MSMADLLAAFDLIEGHEEEADVEGPKSETLITHAEATLGVRFPPTYRRFLERLGCGDIAGFEVYGLIGPEFDSGNVPNGIWLTLDLRRTGHLPHQLVLIADTGLGGYYAIDTRISDADGENPIVEWISGVAEPVDGFPRFGDDFGAFFRQNIEDMLAD